MKFCPECEAKLKKIDSELQCAKCGYVDSQTVESQTTEPKKAEDEPTTESGTPFNVFEGNEGEESHPTIKIDCEKCGNDEAVWWMLQTRSADEPTTQFYRCTKCKHTWRNYA